jgi:hypothetical protein
MYKYLQGLWSHRITRVKVNGKWYKVQNGHWVGAIPPVAPQQSWLQNPIGNAVNAGLGAGKSLEDNVLKRILYGVVMVGSFLLVMTGFAMIGFDLTLGGSKTAKAGLGLTPLGKLSLGKTVAERRRQRPPSDRELMGEYRRGESQGARQAARNEGARVARSRIAKPQNLSPKPKYTGARNDDIPF